jgi:hypothetical protein
MDKSNIYFNNGKKKLRENTRESTLLFTQSKQTLTGRLLLCNNMADCKDLGVYKRLKILYTVNCLF